MKGQPTFKESEKCILSELQFGAGKRYFMRGVADRITSSLGGNVR